MKRLRRKGKGRKKCVIWEGVGQGYYLWVSETVAFHFLGKLMLWSYHFRAYSIYLENDGLLRGLFRQVNHEFPETVGIRDIFYKAFSR